MDVVCKEGSYGTNLEGYEKFLDMTGFVYPGNVISIPVIDASKPSVILDFKNMKPFQTKTSCDSLNAQTHQETVSESKLTEDVNEVKLAEVSNNTKVKETAQCKPAKNKPEFDAKIRLVTSHKSDGSFSDQILMLSLSKNGQLIDFELDDFNLEDKDITELISKAIAKAGLH